MDVVVGVVTVASAIAVVGAVAVCRSWLFARRSEDRGLGVAIASGVVPPGESGSVAIASGAV